MSIIKWLWHFESDIILLIIIEQISAETIGWIVDF